MVLDISSNPTFLLEGQTVVLLVTELARLMKFAVQ